MVTMHILQSSLLSQVDRVFHGFFYPGRNGKTPDTAYNFSFKNGSIETVLQARRQACGMLKIDETRLTHVYQVHGTAVWNVRAGQRGAGALDGTKQIGEGDAMITEVSDVPLAVLIADCLPVFIAEREGRAVGIVHAGWRGSLDNIGGHTVQEMRRRFEMDAAGLLVWIGPGISHHHFEVGREVWDQFQERWGTCDTMFYERDSLYLDLKELNRHQLVRAGVLPDNIETAAHCTYQNRDMFSYRRDGAVVGHNLAVIGKRNG